MVEFAAKPSVSTTLCIYDRSGSYTRTITSATTKLKLSNVTKVDKTAITRIAFQTAGGSAIKLEQVFLSDDGLTPTGIGAALQDNGQMKNGNTIYDLQGRMLNSQFSQLKKGLYIRNGKKIIIR